MMTDLELQVASWHERKYGKNINIPATYKKLLEEVGELGEAIMTYDADAIYEEAGDIAFVLMHIIRDMYPDNPSLMDAVAHVLDKNEKRLTLYLNRSE